MKSKHRMKKHDRDILILDDNSVWRADSFDTSKASFWTTFDELEVEDSGFSSTITNLSRKEAIKAKKIS